MATFMALFDGATTPWRADPVALTPVIRSVWTDVAVDASHRSEACGFRWTVETEEGPVEAYLDEDGTCLYLDTSLADAARLACLFRHFVPPDVELVLCDVGYNFHLVLRPGIDNAELIEQMNAAD
ncbi:hypothetical protein ACFVJM_39520 [Streptomyces virginiae]|uniref:hypothetical protein n=1 Tax=Streptomyces virginiae TaxID=1961 RepID=UPI00363302F3